MRHRGMYRYIESEKGQTKTHRAREVRDRASPDRSRETDETSGMGLTQEQRRSNGVGSVSRPVLPDWELTKGGSAITSGCQQRA